MNLYNRDYVLSYKTQYFISFTDAKGRQKSEISKRVYFSLLFLSHFNSAGDKKDYILWSRTRYFASFTNSDGKQEVEITKPVYLELLLRDVGENRNQQRSDERHKEKSDEMLYTRIYVKPKSAEDEFIDNMQYEELSHLIDDLPEKQRRRFKLHFYDTLTYEDIATMERRSPQEVKDIIGDIGNKSLTLQQIADLESCSPQAIKISVDIAKQKIKEVFKSFFEN